MTCEEFNQKIREGRAEWVRRGKMVWVAESEFVCDACGRRNEKAVGAFCLYEVVQVDGSFCRETCKCGEWGTIRFIHIGRAFRLESLEGDGI